MGELSLGIDLDGVIADFNTGWLARSNREFGAELEPSQVVAWEGVPRSPTSRTWTPSGRWAA